MIVSRHNLSLVRPELDRKSQLHAHAPARPAAGINIIYSRTCTRPVPAYTTHAHGAPTPQPAQRLRGGPRGVEGGEGGGGHLAAATASHGEREGEREGAGE